MLHNILLITMGAVFGALVLGVIEANIRIMYIRKISALKISNSKISNKNKRLFDDLQEAQLQVELLQSYLIDEAESIQVNYTSDDC